MSLNLPVPFTGAQLRAALLTLEGEVGSGVAVPALPLSGEQIRTVLNGLEAALRAGGRIITGDRAPAPPDGVNGDYWFQVTAGGGFAAWGPKLTGDWGAEPIFSYDGGLPTPPPRRLLLEKVKVPDPWDLDLMPATRTLARVSASVRGVSPNVTFGLFHGPVPGVAGVEVVAGGIQVTAQTVVEVFDSAVIPEGDWLWFDVLALSGAVEKLSVGVEYA